MKRLDRELVRDASIVSVNSIGGEISEILGLRYNSPFVGCSMDRNDFVALCESLEDYMSFFNCTIANVLTGSCKTYMMNGVLKTMTIYWPFAVSRKRAEDSFIRRAKRINYDKLVLILDDRGLSEDSLARFDRIKCFRKICLTSSPEYAEKYACCHYLKEYSGKPHVGKYQDMGPDSLYRFENTWDYVSFLNGQYA